MISLVNAVQLVLYVPVKLIGYLHISNKISS